MEYIKGARAIGQYNPLQPQQSLLPRILSCKFTLTAIMKVLALVLILVACAVSQEQARDKRGVLGVAAPWAGGLVAPWAGGVVAAPGVVGPVVAPGVVAAHGGWPGAWPGAVVVG